MIGYFRLLLFCKIKMMSQTTLYKVRNSIQVIAITPFREQDSTAEYRICTRSNALCL